MASLIGVFEVHGTDDGRITAEAITTREAKSRGYIRNTRPLPSKFTPNLPSIGYKMRGGFQ